MGTYVKKPVAIEAFQLTYEMAIGKEPVPAWFNEAVLGKKIEVFVTDKLHGSQYCLIKTEEGTMRADRDDFIIKGIKGEYYPCKPDIFKASYESEESLMTALPTEGLDFGNAVRAAKQGRKVARAGWNGAGMFAYIVPAASYPAQTGIAKSHFGEDGMVPYREYWALKTAQNDVATWAPSGSDSLAEDWMIL